MLRGRGSRACTGIVIGHWLITSAHPQMSLKIMGTSVSFQFRNEQFCARSRKSRDCAEAYKWYVAQAIPKIDTEIAEEGHFWMETN
jgi:hypothetical protein